MFENQDEFEDQTFEHLEGSDAVVEGREFHQCQFKNCRFSNTSFVRCRFVDCTFQKCDLSNLIVRGTSFRDVTFENSKMIGIAWIDTNTISHLNFVECILNYCNFSGLDLRKSRIENCTAREVEFGQTKLSDSNCQGTDFAGSRFLNTDLSKSDFRRAINYAIRPLDNIVKKAKFSLPEATALLFGLDITLE